MITKSSRKGESMKILAINRFLNEYQVFGETEDFHIKFLTILFLSLIFIVIPNGVLAEDKKASFIGVKKCKKCHTVLEDNDYYDNAFDTWQEMEHANAYKNLASEKGMAIAAKHGISDPQNDNKCLECHTTAYDVSDDLKKRGYHKENGVSCEACHGAGSVYKKLKNHAYDRKVAVANGLKMYDTADAMEKNCTTCHSDKSREICNDKIFSPKLWNKIAHPTMVNLEGAEFKIEKIEKGETIELIRTVDGETISKEDWNEQVKLEKPVDED
jgi:hypothetical protein